LEKSTANGYVRELPVLFAGNPFGKGLFNFSKLGTRFRKTCSGNLPQVREGEKVCES